MSRSTYNLSARVMAFFSDLFRFLLVHRQPRSFNSSRWFLPAWMSPSKPYAGPKIDIVFAMDCTASMGTYIESAKTSIQSIVEKISSHQNTDFQFGYVAYRDHHKSDAFVTKCHNFMSDPSQMEAAISTYGASGGGDAPEAVTSALYEAMNFPWRKEATKVVIIIADAPPHGIGVNGDALPLGDPTGLDPIEIANEMALRGIILHVVSCASLALYKNARDVMEGLTLITEGRYIPLDSSDLLPELIIAATKEELSLRELENSFLDDIQEMKDQHMTTEEISERLQTMMAEQGTKAEQIAGDFDQGYNRTNIEKISASASLKEARSQMKELNQPKVNIPKPSTYETVCSLAPSLKVVNRMAKKKMI